MNGWPKNVVVYAYQDVPNDLNEKMTSRIFTPCSGLDWFSQGWVPPASHSQDLLYRGQGYYMVSLRRDDKVLPNGIIKNLLNQKVDEIELKELRKVGRKEKASLKDTIVDDLLPKAFTRQSKTNALIGGGFVYVNSSSHSKGDDLISAIREAAPPFPCRLIQTNMSPSQLMTDWLARGEAQNSFVLDSECELQDGSENGGVVRCSRMDLTSEEIRHHLATGKKVTRLGLIWRERIRFVLTDSMQLKKLQFLDVLQEEASQAGDDAQSLFDATLHILANELEELVHDLISTLGGLVEKNSQEAVTQASAVEEINAPWT